MLKNNTGHSLGVHARTYSSIDGELPGECCRGVTWSVSCKAIQDKTTPNPFALSRTPSRHVPRHVSSSRCVNICQVSVKRNVPPSSLLSAQNDEGRPSRGRSRRRDFFQPLPHDRGNCTKESTAFVRRSPRSTRMVCQLTGARFKERRVSVADALPALFRSRRRKLSSDTQS